MHELCYPFAAIVGQESAKKALMLNLINPRIGGVLLSGEKGTAKSTIVRGVAQLGGKQVVDLPLNATEDMLVGSIDFEATVRNGVRSFAGGVLARAHGNILYVDEINLLADNMAAAITTAASAGENRVEREGISARHDCSFILVGTMNPEEGGLRPQLLDKFGLYVGVAGEHDPKLRVEIIRRRLAYERDPAGFLMAYQTETERLQKTLQKAVALLPAVTVDENVRCIAAKLAVQAFCEGNRAELLLSETASAIAAMDGRKHVTVGDIKEAAEYVLPHRRRELTTQNELQQQNQRNKQNNQRQDNTDTPDDVPPEQPETQNEYEPEDGNGEGEPADAEYPPDSPQEDERADASEEQIVAGDEVYQIIRLPGDTRDRLARKGAGRRRKTNSSANKGRYAGFSAKKQKGAILHWMRRCARPRRFKRSAKKTVAPFPCAKAIFAISREKAMWGQQSSLWWMQAVLWAQPSA